MRKALSSPDRFAEDLPIPTPLFAVNAITEGDAFILRLSGELDLAQCPILEQALAQAETSSARWVLLDLDELTFVDAAGLHALLVASRLSASNGNRLRLTRPKGEVAAIFRLTALDLTFPFATTDSAP